MANVSVCHLEELARISDAQLRAGRIKFFWTLWSNPNKLLCPLSVDARQDNSLRNNYQII